MISIFMKCERCSWAGDDEIYIRYHDEEWGVPTHDDRELFEMLVLESFQAGLSWITILKKRENFRKAFDGFDIEKVEKSLPQSTTHRYSLKFRKNLAALTNTSGDSPMAKSSRRNF